MVVVDTSSTVNQSAAFTAQVIVAVNPIDSGGGSSGSKKARKMGVAVHDVSLAWDPADFEVDEGANPLGSPPPDDFFGPAKKGDKAQAVWRNVDPSGGAVVLSLFMRCRRTDGFGVLTGFVNPPTQGRPNILQSQADSSQAHPFP